jgi:hypothetical protein
LSDDAQRTSHVSLFVTCVTASDLTSYLKTLSVPVRSETKKIASPTHIGSRSVRLVGETTFVAPDLRS